MSKYDVIVVGACPAGMLATYELIENHPKCKRFLHYSLPLLLEVLSN